MTTTIDKGAVDAFIAISHDIPIAGGLALLDADARWEGHEHIWDRGEVQGLPAELNGRQYARYRHRCVVAQWGGFGWPKEPQICAATLERVAAYTPPRED